MSLVESLAHGDVVEIRMARPPVNALDPALCAALRDAIAAALDAGAQGLVLAGGGNVDGPKVFSGGLDVPYLLSLGSDRAALTAAWQSFFDTAQRIAECPVPVAAAIGGHAPAGGCVLALCCDYRVMASGPFRIGLNETQVGLPVPEGIQRLMRRAVGVNRSERMLVGGEMVEAETALAYGLVDELVGLDEVAQRARMWLEGLLALPRAPLLQTRAIARADVLEALRPEHIRLDRFIDAWATPDCQSALRALVARLGK